MTLFITFFNLSALIVFLVGGIWALVTFIFMLIETMTPGYELRELTRSYHGKKLTYPWVQRSILPCAALLWLISAYLTGNLFP